MKQKVKFQGNKMTLTGKEKLFLLYKMMWLVKYQISLSKVKKKFSKIWHPMQEKKIADK